MKQIALSLFVIAASGTYVFDQHGNGPAGDMLDTAGSGNSADSNVLNPGGLAPTTAATTVPSASSEPANNQRGARINPEAPRPAPHGTEHKAAIAEPNPAAPKPTAHQFAEDAPYQTAPFAITPAIYIPVPKPRPNYLQAPAIVFNAGMKAAGHSFADGTYAGPITDAYYGLIQIQASIQDGRLTSIKVLKYPNDRRTSVNINRQALPMLRDEAISAQSANVDIISGATLTSRAFRQSLAGALDQASS